MSSGSGSGSGGGGGASSAYGFGVGLAAGGANSAVAQQGQGVAALLVMLAVLCFIFAYCCWGAPFCRSLCRRYCCCRLEDTDSESGFGPGASGTPGTHGASANADQAMLATPTIILLPHGRMLVVDGTIFTQFQAENTGLDLVELGESVMRAQRNPSGVTRHQLQNSQGSIIEMDAETPSKDSMGSLGCFPPPTYESIYGKEEGVDMPPSYSDILLHRFANLPYEIEMQDYGGGSGGGGGHHHGHDSKEEIEMRSLENCPHIISNPINSLTYPYAAALAAAGRYSSQSLPRQQQHHRHQQHQRNPSLISNPLDGYYVDNELAALHLYAHPQQSQSQSQQRRRSASTTTAGGGGRGSRPRTRRTSCNGVQFAASTGDEGAAAGTAGVGAEELAAGGGQQRMDRAASERRDSRTNADDRPASDNVLDNRYAHPWDQASRAQNDAMNSLNSARSDSRSRSEDQHQQQQHRHPDDLPRANLVYVRSRRSEGSNAAMDDEPMRLHRESRISQSTDPLHWNLNDLDVRYGSDLETSARPDSSRSDRHSERGVGDEASAAEDDPSNFKALADIRESRV